LEYTPQELTGVLYYWLKDEDAKVKNEWEKTRIQTFFLIDIQLPKKNKMSYERFRKELWPFPWEERIGRNNKDNSNAGEGVMSFDDWKKIIFHQN